MFASRAKFVRPGIAGYLIGRSRPVLILIPQAQPYCEAVAHANFILREERQIAVAIQIFGIAISLHVGRRQAKRHSLNCRHGRRRCAGREGQRELLDEDVASAEVQRQGLIPRGYEAVVDPGLKMVTAGRTADSVEQLIACVIAIGRGESVPSHACDASHLERGSALVVGVARTRTGRIEGLDDLIAPGDLHAKLVDHT